MQGGVVPFKIRRLSDRFNLGPNSEKEQELCPPCFSSHLWLLDDYHVFDSDKHSRVLSVGSAIIATYS